MWIDYFRELDTTQINARGVLMELWIDYFRELDTTADKTNSEIDVLWIDYFRAGVVSTFSGMGEDWCVLK